MLDFPYPLIKKQQQKKTKQRNKQNKKSKQNFGSFRAYAGQEKKVRNSICAMIFVYLLHLVGQYK